MVEHRDDCHKVSRNYEENRVRESAKLRALNWRNDDWKLPGTLPHSLEDGLDLIEESFDECWVAWGVPRECVLDVGLSARPNDQVMHG